MCSVIPGTDLSDQGLIKNEDIFLASKCTVLEHDLSGNMSVHYYSSAYMSQELALIRGLAGAFGRSFDLMSGSCVISIKLRSTPIKDSGIILNT